MACSDNVVRAGLTPKLRDTEVLCKMLNYNASDSEAMIMSGHKIGGYTVRYKAGPNITEFRLERMDIDSKGKEEKLEIVDTKHPSIILVYAGKGNLNGMEVENGHCMLLSPKVQTLSIQNKADSPFQMARCYAPSD